MSLNKLKGWTTIYYINSHTSGSKKWYIMKRSSRVNEQRWGIFSTFSYLWQSVHHVGTSSGKRKSTTNSKMATVYRSYRKVYKNNEIYILMNLHVLLFMYSFLIHRHLQNAFTNKICKFWHSWRWNLFIKKTGPQSNQEVTKTNTNLYTGEKHHAPSYSRTLKNYFHA